MVGEPPTKDEIDPTSRLDALRLPVELAMTPYLICESAGLELKAQYSPTHPCRRIRIASQAGNDGTCTNYKEFLKFK
jgi:hypothetical protein